MSNDDLVTVIVPAFNVEKYIDQCLQSLVEQTYKNIEILVLNDGSKDGTLEKLNSWKFKDDRIQVISRENKGLIASLNELISQSQGRFIARMDADDYCHVDRIRLQVAALSSDLALVGSNCFVVDDESTIVGRFKYEKKHIHIDVDGFFRAQFCHPSVVFDLKKIHRNDLYYDNRYPHAEDLELWFRLLKKYRCGNLSHNLVYIRRGHETNVSVVHAKEQFDNAVNVVLRYAEISINYKDIINLRQRGRLFSFAGAGFRVGLALFRKSAIRGVMFFRKFLLIFIIACARKTFALAKGLI